MNADIKTVVKRLLALRDKIDAAVDLLDGLPGVESQLGILNFAENSEQPQEGQTAAPEQAQDEAETTEGPQTAAKAGQKVDQLVQSEEQSGEDEGGNEPETKAPINENDAASAKNPNRSASMKRIWAERRAARNGASVAPTTTVNIKSAVQSRASVIQGNTHDKTEEAKRLLDVVALMDEPFTLADAASEAEMDVAQVSELLLGFERQGLFQGHQGQWTTTKKFQTLFKS